MQTEAMRGRIRRSKPVEESFVLLKVAGGEASGDEEDVEVGQRLADIRRL